MKLVKVLKSYTNKEGKEIKFYDFYLEIEGLDNLVAISPKKYGDKKDNYSLLCQLAKTRK